MYTCSHQNMLLKYELIIRESLLQYILTGFPGSPPHQSMLQQQSSFGKPFCLDLAQSLNCSEVLSSTGNFDTNLIQENTTARASRPSPCWSCFYKRERLHKNIQKLRRWLCGVQHYPASPGLVNDRFLFYISLRISITLSLFKGTVSPDF